MPSWINWDFLPRFTVHPRSTNCVVLRMLLLVFPTSADNLISLSTVSPQWLFILRKVWITTFFFMETSVPFAAKNRGPSFTTSSETIRKEPFFNADSDKTVTLAPESINHQLSCPLVSTDDRSGIHTSPSNHDASSPGTQSDTTRPKELPWNETCFSSDTMPDLRPGPDSCITVLPSTTISSLAVPTMSKKHWPEVPKEPRRAICRPEPEASSWVSCHSPSSQPSPSPSSPSPTSYIFPLPCPLLLALGFALGFTLPFPFWSCLPPPLAGFLLSVLFWLWPWLKQFLPMCPVFPHLKHLIPVRSVLHSLVLWDFFPQRLQLSPTASTVSDHSAPVSFE